MLRRLGLWMIYGGLTACLLGLLAYNGPYFYSLHGQWSVDLLDWSIPHGRWAIKLAAYAGRASIYGAPFLVGGVLLAFGILTLRVGRRQTRALDASSSFANLNAARDFASGDVRIEMSDQHV
jgi:hypothetical protein